MKQHWQVSGLILVLLLASPGALLWGQGATSEIKDDPELKAALALLEAQLSAFWQEKKIVGLSAAVIYDQEIIWTTSFGYADLEEKIPATPQTIYRIHSISKLFTATMLMQLRDQGKLQLDDPLVKYVPEFQLKSRFGDLPPVTLRQLASHTAGVPKDPPPPTGGVADDRWEIEPVLTALKDAEMSFPPLTEYKYSNLGYALLGHALSQVAGQPYEDHIQEHILKPLGMSHSGCELTPELRPYAAKAYSRYQEGRPRRGRPYRSYGGRCGGFFVPAWGLFSSVEDMARFISLQFRNQNQPAGGTQVLRGSSVREMHTMQWLMPSGDWGLGIGFAIERVGDHLRVGHGGGYRTTVRLVPAAKVGLAIFTNTRMFPENPNAITQEGLELLVPVIERAVARQNPIKSTIPPAVWQKYLGLYERKTEGETKVAEIKLVNDQLRFVNPLDAYGLPRGETQLIPDGEHRFRIKEGSFKGELVVFVLNAAGNVTEMRMAGGAFRPK
jgi:CubicO group peptidase (beta-lactamase class C family)